MSYSILLTGKKGEHEEIPISTNNLFHDYWLPLFQEYQLQNLINIQYLHYIDNKELEKIINEFEKIRPKIYNEIHKERIDFILVSLKKIEFKNYDKISVG